MITTHKYDQLPTEIIKKRLRHYRNLHSNTKRKKKIRTLELILNKREKVMKLINPGYAPLSKYNYSN